MFNYYWKTCHIPCRCFVQKDIGTWRTPRRVNMEQNMQWRRQGVNRESATVITCIDFNVPTFWFDSILLLANKRKQSFMCWYHNSKSNWEASDGSLPGMWKLVIILNNFRTSTLNVNFCSHLTHELGLKGVQIWETFAEEKSHLFSTGFLAVEEQPQGTVFVHWLTFGELLELPNAVFHKGLELSHVLRQNIKTPYQPSGKTNLGLLFICILISNTCQRREKQGSWEMRQWSWQPRGLTGHWQWWCSTSSPFTAPPSEISIHPPRESPPPSCLLWLPAAHACSQEAVEVVFIGAVSTQLCHQTKHHSTVCSFWN